MNSLHYEGTVYHENDFHDRCNGYGSGLGCGDGYEEGTGYSEDNFDNWGDGCGSGLGCGCGYIDGSGSCSSLPISISENV